MHESMPFDTLTDFTPISLLGTTPNVLIANAAAGITSLADLIEKAKAAPGELSYGSSGVGASSHLGVVLLEQMAGIDLTHVPYKGAGQAAGAVAANEVPLLFTSTGAATPLIQSGQVVPIAVSSPQRAASLPDVPTVAESGFPDYAVESWYGLFGPAGMPSELVDKIYGDIAAVLADPELKAKLEESGYTIVGEAPAEFAPYVKQQYELWGEVVKAASVQAE
jgi:tripartite-type tricarboxylate transporter receptor subunit TctC